MILSPDILRYATVITTMLLIGLACQAAQPQALESASWLPDSCVAMVAVESVDEFAEQFKKTPAFALYKDPAMKPIVASVEAKIRENLKKSIASFWQEMKINRPPQTLPWPQGRCVIGVVATEREFQHKSHAKEGQARERVTETDLDLQFIGVAEMGKQTEAMSKLLQQIAGASQESDSLHRSRRVGSTQLHWITADGDLDPDYDTFCYALQGQHLIVSSSARLAEQTLKNLQRPSEKTLARSKTLISLAREVQDGSISFYVEAEPIRKILVNLLPDKQKWQVQRALQELGLQSVEGLISSIRLNNQPQEVLRWQTLLATDGPPQGALALICPESAELKLNSQLFGPDVALFAQSHIDLSKLYDRIVQMVRKINGMDLNFFVQTALAATGGPQAPVDLKRDLLDQMAMPLSTVTVLKRPFSDPDQARDLWSIPLRNSNTVDTALARLHQTFIASRDPKLQRKMLDHTLYLLPEITLASAPESDLEGKATVANLAFSVVKDELFFGRLDDLEQLVRNTRKDHPKKIAQNPMFRAMRRHFPSQAGHYTYADLRVSGEFGWELLRQSLKNIRELDRKPPQSQADSNDQYETERSLADDFFWELSELVQAEQLPPYPRIQNHFGASISYGKRSERGIFSETVILRAQNQPN